MSALRRQREGAPTNTLSITVDGPGVADGSVPVATLVAALDGAQDAVRLMVEHLGDREHRRGPPPQWVREQSELRWTRTRPDSVVFDLALEPPQAGQAYLDQFGAQAIAAIQAWDGSEDSTLPSVVTDRLYEAASAVDEGVRLWIGGPEDGPRVEIKRRDRGASRRPQDEEALLHGWLREVNWDKRTAQLHDYAEGHVRLRFNAALDDEMLRLATQYVEVRGAGRFGKDGEWTSVQVEQLSETRSSSVPYDLDAFLNDPNSKSFDPDDMVTTGEPFDVDEFLRGIYEARDA